MAVEDKVEQSTSPEDVILQKADEIKVEEKFVADTEKKMQEVFSSTPKEEPEPEPETTPEKSEPESTPEVKPAEEEPEKPAVEEKVSPESADDKKLPDALYRAAIHQGWKPDDITDFFNEKPELCLQTLGKIYDSTNKVSKEFAAIGRAKTTPAPAPVVAPAKPTESDFKKIDTAQLEKDYPDDPTVKAIVAIQAQSQRIYDELQTIKSQPSAQKVDEAALRKELEETQKVETEVIKYFGSDNLKPYDIFYGVLPKGSKTWFEGLTKEQQDRRFTVVVEANNILIGAKAQNIEMTVDEAMSRSHLIVSEPVRTQIIRNDLKKSVSQRNKGITLTPHNVVRGKENVAQSKSDFEKATAQRMGKAFGD